MPLQILQNALYLAWSDTKARYKKSILGPLWPTLINLLSVLGLSLVWASLMKQDMQTFVPQLAIGLVAWQLIAGVISEAPATFTRQAGMIKNVAISSWFFSLRSFARHLINFTHNALIIIGVLLYYKTEINQYTWLFLPGLLLVALNLYWMLHFLGLAGARFRDIEPLIAGIVPVLFFLSPVIYRADQLPPDLNLVWMNPLSYMIEAIRSPILGTPPHSSTYTVLLAMLIIGSVLTWWYQVTEGKKLAFWV